jgi:phage-related protein
VIQALLPVIVTVFGVIAEVVTSAMQIVQGIIQVVTGIISGTWAQVWDGIRNIVSGVWNTIVSLVKGALQIIGQVVISGLGLVGNFVSSTLNGIGRFFADTWNNVIRGVGGFIDGFMRFFYDLPGKIMGALSGAGTWLLGIGKNIVDGLINGITGMAGTVARAILNLVPEAIRGPIEAALGIHSPSRVAMWWGEMIGDGLAGGIDDSQRKVARSMGSLVSIPDVAGAVRSTSNIAGPLGQRGGVTFTGPVHVRDENELARIIQTSQMDALAVYQ